MKKIQLELTPEQYLSLTNILTSISIGHYDELPNVRNKVIEILKDISPKITEQEKVVIDNISNEPIPRTIKKARRKKEEKKEINILPNEWFDTYNVRIENNFELDLISNSENLRFIYGKQGQIGIEYWEHFGRDEDKVTMFIKNSDAEELLYLIRNIMLTSDSLTDKYIDIEETFSEKYELKITKIDGNTTATICKDKGNNCIDIVKFHNEKQLILFYQFMEHHLGF